MRGELHISKGVGNNLPLPKEGEWEGFGSGPTALPRKKQL